MIYQPLTPETAIEQVRELKSAIAILPKQYELARAILQRQIDDRQTYLDRESEAQRVRVDQARSQQEQKPQPDFMDLDGQKAIADLVAKRRMVEWQLSNASPYYKVELQQRINEIDLQIAKLSEVPNDAA